MTKLTTRCRVCTFICVDRYVSLYVTSIRRSLIMSQLPDTCIPLANHLVLYIDLSKLLFD